MSDFTIDCCEQTIGSMAASLYVLRPTNVFLDIPGIDRPLCLGDVITIQPSRNEDRSLSITRIRCAEIFSRNRPREWPPGGPHAIVAFRVTQVTQRQLGLWAVRLDQFGPDATRN